MANDNRVRVGIDVGLGERPERRERSSGDNVFRIAVLGRLSGNGQGPILVDRDNFDEVLERMGVELELPLKQKLAFRTLDDFHPDSLYGCAAIFDRLREARKKLSDPTTFRQTMNTLKLAAPAPPPPQPTAPHAARGFGLLDQMLDAAPAEVESPKPGFDDAGWQELLRRVVEPHLVAKQDPKQAEMVARIDQLITEQMRAVLHDPEFQALEAAWRSLYWLITRLETGEDLKVYLVDSTLSQAAARIRKLADQEDWALFVGNYTIDPTSDLGLLSQTGEAAQAARAPFVAGASPRFLGVPSLYQSDPDDWSSLDSTGQAAWHAVRHRPDAGWIGLAMPRFLLRMPYGKRGSSVDNLEFEEMDPGEASPLLWANPAIACAYLLGEAFSRSGWAMRPGEVRDLDGLPVYNYTRAAQPEMTPGAEVWMSERQAEALLDQGIMPLASIKHTDSACMVRIQSIADPPSELHGRWS